MPTEHSKHVTLRWDDETREMVLTTPHEQFRLATEVARDLWPFDSFLTILKCSIVKARRE